MPARAFCQPAILVPRPAMKLRFVPFSVGLLLVGNTRTAVASLIDALYEACGFLLVVNKHQSGTPYEFCLISCMHLWRFIRGGVPIGADRDPTCIPYF